MPNKPYPYATISKVALGLYVLVLFTATHVPPNTPFLPPEIGHIDKLYHFTAYAILAALIATTWQLSSGVLTKGQLVCLWIVILFLGAVDELTQIPVHRDCDFWDWVADACGSAAGLWAFASLRWRFMPRDSTRE
jgi:VanZ family protein